MHEIYTIFRKIVDELGLRENIYGYSIILTALTIPIIILLIFLAKLLRFLNKMCDKNNKAGSARVMYLQNIFLYFCLTGFSVGCLMLICTICQCFNRRQNCMQTLTHISAVSVPIKLHRQCPRDKIPQKIEPSVQSDALNYHNTLVPYATVLT